MKRLALLFTLTAAAAFPQLVSFGIKAGVPFTDAFDTVQQRDLSYVSDTRRYTFGPMVELNLPFGLAVELDALYKRLSYEAALAGTNEEFLRRTVKGNAWDFPLLLKLRTGMRPLQAYFSVGPTFRTLSNLEQAGSFFSGAREDQPLELEHRFTTGFTAGVGLRLGNRTALSPEVRYTRWGWESFRSPQGLLRSNPDQLEFLMGLTF